MFFNNIFFLLLDKIEEYNPDVVFLGGDIFDDALVISPDMGAMERARYYAEMLGCDVGVFYKRRDLSKLVDGKNPIVEQ